MRNGLKRALSAALTVLMLLTLVPAGVATEVVEIPAVTIETESAGADTPAITVSDNTVVPGLEVYQQIEAENSFYQQLMAAESCYEMLDMMNAEMELNNGDDLFALDMAQLATLQDKLNGMEDDGGKAEVQSYIDTLIEMKECTCGTETGEHETWCPQYLPQTYPASYTVPVGEPVTISGSSGSNHKWTIESDSTGSVTLSGESSNSNNVIATGVKEGIVTITHSYKNNGGKDRSEIITVNVVAAGTIINGHSFSHIEIEIAGTASLKIDDKEYSQNVEITTDDEFTITAYTLDAENKQVAFTGFSYNGDVVDGDGSTNNETVELSGTYYTGTLQKPIWYVVTLQKDVTFTLDDKSTMTVPITLVVTTHYWNANNCCPGVSYQKESWSAGNYISNGSGIDVAVSGETVGQAITEGKLAIRKIIYGNSSDTTAFTFTIQKSSGEYMVFNEQNACTGSSSSMATITVNGGSTVTLTDVPEGVYRVTEIQKDGYVITDVDGQETGNYTVDYTVETKDNDLVDIPVATFTNKKLINEARISIRKIASGMSSPLNPEVSIYRTDVNGQQVGDAVWTGGLVANGDTIYPNVDFEDGVTYVIVETDHEATDFTCETTLSVSGDGVNGMTFTAKAGERHDLIVQNVYTPKPSTTTVTISKIVTGNMGDRSKPFNFTVTGKMADDSEVVFTMQDGVTTDDYEISADGKTVSFTIAHDGSVTIYNVPIGANLEISESGSDYQMKVNGELCDNNTYTYCVSESNTGVEIENHKTGTVDTGILLDSLPYILILGVVAVLGGGMVFRRRRARD